MFPLSGRKALAAGIGLSVVGLLANAASPIAHAAPASPVSSTTLGRLSTYIAQAKASKTTHVLSDRYFVQLSGPATLNGGSAAALTSAQSKLQAAVKAAGIPMSVRRSYRSAFNGFSVTLKDADVARLAAVSGVSAIFPVVAVSIPVTTSAKPTDADANDLIGASVAQSELGYTGKGIKVGVIDSGIDYNHPDLGGKGVHNPKNFPTKRVAYGYDFVGDAYDPDSGVAASPDPYPDDCLGHGTHVAGIVGAKGKVTGVAPDVIFGDYRVFGCAGTGDTDVILAALERAGADHMDIVNLSLGESFMSWPDYPDAQAASALAKHGTIVVAAAGNDGESGTFTAGAPSVGASVLSVASTENSNVTAWAVRVGGVLHGYTPADGSATIPRSGSLTLVSAGADDPNPSDATSPVLGCTSLPPAPAAGTAIVIERGVCNFSVKAANAQSAGYAAVVLYDRTSGFLSVSVGAGVTVPVIMLQRTDGLALQALLASGPQTLTWTSQTVTTPNPSSGLTSSFSSAGLAADLSLKPDLSAPGGGIWSTYPLSKGGYNSARGTSEASPMVAGSVALLLQAQPSLKGDSQAVRGLLQNTANLQDWSLLPGNGFLEPVVRQGAGLVQIDKAILTLQSVLPSELSLGDVNSSAHRNVLTFANRSAKPVKYRLSSITSIGTLGTSDPRFDLLDAVVSMPATLTVPARGTASVNVTITEPSGAATGYIYGGWIEASTRSGTSLRVPYAGMAGSYQQIRVLTNAADGTSLPALGVYSASDDAVVPVYPGPGKQHYTMAGNDLAYVVFHLEYPASDVRLDVYRAKANGNGAKGALVGTVVDIGEAGRDGAAQAIGWDGSYLAGPSSRPYTARVGAGSYVLELKVLKPLGNPNLASNWEVFDTPVFSIDAPSGSTLTIHTAAWNTVVKR